MKTVNEMKDIEENIQTFNKYLQDKDLKEFVVGLTKRGTCFVAIRDENGYSFYPSRYIGYKGNTNTAHMKNDEKDGRDTNPAISIILGQKTEPSIELEKEYKKYCEKLGFIANDKGAFGVQHKYWLV